MRSQVSKPSMSVSDSESPSINSSQANTSEQQMQSNADDLYHQRLLLLLQELDAQVDDVGKVVVQFIQALNAFPIDKYPLTTLRDLIPQLVPAAQLDSLQRLELIQKLQNEIAKLEAEEHAELKDKLIQVQLAYQHFIQTFNESSNEQRLKLVEKSVQLWCDRLPDPYLISITDAQTLTSSDPYGNTVKTNAAGNRPVAVKGGLFFKVNPSRDHIAPATEQAVVNFYQLFAEDEFIAAPTALVKIQHLPVQTLLPKIKQTDRAAFEEYNNELLSGKPATRILADGNLSSKLQFTTVQTGKVLQVGYGLGDMYLRDMLAVVAMFDELSKKMPQQQLATLYQTVIESENYLSLLKKEQAELLSDAAQHQNTLLTYWLDFLNRLPIEQIPKGFIDFDKMESNKLKLIWCKLIDQYGLELITQAIALFQFCPLLMTGYSFNEVMNYPRLLSLAPYLWPQMEINEVITTIQTWLRQGDRKHFSKLIVSSMLTNPSDGKADNYRVKFKRNERGQAIEWQIQAIDNDNTLVEAVTFDASSRKFKAGFNVNVLCILYFLPMMSEKIDLQVRELILSKSAVHWVLDWLYQLYCHDQKYKQFIQQGILTKDDLVDASNEAMLDIPFTLRTDLIREIYIKWITLQTTLKKNPDITLQELFAILEPLLAHYYSAIQSAHPQPIDAFHVIYQTGRAPIDEVLLNANSEGRLSAGYQQAITKELQSIKESAIQKYQAKANGEECAPEQQSIDEALNEVLSYINLASFPMLVGYELLTAISRFPDLIISLKADQDVQGQWLRMAVAQGNIDTVALLLRSGVNVNLADERGFTALHQFAKYFDQPQYTDERAEQMASLLLSVPNLSPHVENEHGLPPLFYALQAAKREPRRTERFLQLWTAHKISLDNNALEKEVDPTANANNNNAAPIYRVNSKSALDKCIERDHSQAFILLAKYGASHVKDIRATAQFIEKHIALQGMPAAQKHLQQQNPKFNYESALATLTSNVPAASAVKLQGALSGTRYLSAELAAIVLDESGHLRKQATRQNAEQNPDAPQIQIFTNGRHPVTRVTWRGKSLVFKEQPDLPGIDYAVSSFAQALIGHGTAYNELFAVKDKAGKTYPLLIAEFIQGENFEHVIEPKKSASNLTKEEAMRFLSQLDPKMISDLKLLCMLINPEDWKPDAFILAPFINAKGETTYRIVGVDNDHALVPAVTMEGSFRKLKLKTIIFCLDTMQAALHPETVRTFLKKDPAIFLRNWLIELERQQYEYGNLIFSSNNSFSLLRKQKLEDSIIGMPFKPKTMSDLYYKFVKLQKVLRKDPTITALTLLRKIMPAVGVYYQEAFRLEAVQTQTPAARFFYLVKDLYGLKDDHYQTMTTNLQVMQSLLMTDKAELQKQASYGPKEALDILEILDLEHNRLMQVIEDCEAGKFTHSFSPINSLLQDSSKEEVIAEIDWSKLSIKQQEILLTSFIGTPFVNLKIKNCEGLSDDILIKLVKQSPDLKLLSLENCPLITGKALSYVSIQAQNLEKLHLTKFNGDYLIVFNNSNFKINRFLNLRRLVLKDCPNLDFFIKDVLKDSTYFKSERDILKHTGLLKLKDFRINDCPKMGLKILQYMLEDSKEFSYLELDHQFSNLDRQLIQQIILRDKLWTKYNMSYFMELSATGDEFLDLSECSGISEADLIKISRCTTVESININNYDLPSLLKYFPALTSVLFTGSYAHSVQPYKGKFPEYVLEINSNDKIYISLNGDKFKVKDIKTNTCIITLQNDSQIKHINVLPNSNIVTFDQKNQIKVWDFEKLYCITLVSFTPIYLFRILSNSNIVIKNASRHIKVLDLQKLISSIKTLQNGSQDCSFKQLPSGDMIAHYHPIFENNEELKYCIAFLSSNIKYVEILPNDNIVTLDEKNQIQIWDSQNYIALHTLQHDSEVTSLAVLPDSNIIFSQNDGNNFVWPHRTSSRILFIYRNRLSSQMMVRKLAHSVMVQLSQTIADDDIAPALTELESLINLAFPAADVSIQKTEIRQMFVRSPAENVIQNVFELLEAYAINNVTLPLTATNLHQPDLTDEEREFCQTHSHTTLPELQITHHIPHLIQSNPEQSSTLQEYNLVEEEVHGSSQHEEDNAMLRLIQLKLAEGFSLETQLFVACEKGELENLRWLLQQGANIRAKTKDAQTPLSIARANGHEHVVNYLQRFKQKLPVSRTLSPKSCVIIRMWSATMFLPLAVVTTTFMDNVNIGHLSIAIRDENGRETYVSHWPERTALFAKGYNNTLVEDLSSEKGLPSAMVVLYSLDSEKMLAYYASIKDKLIWSLSGSTNGNNYNCSGLVYKLLEVGGLFQHLLPKTDMIKFGLRLPQAVINLGKKAQDVENILYPETASFAAEAAQRFSQALKEKAQQNNDILRSFLQFNVDLIFLYAGATQEKVNIQDLTALLALDLKSISLFVQSYSSEIKALLEEMCRQTQDNLDQELIALVKTFNDDEFVISTMNLLIERGAKPTAQDAEGYNALHWAVLQGKAHFVKKILAKFPHAVNSETSIHANHLFAQVRKTPLDLAFETGNSAIIKLITEFGGECNLDHSREQNPNNNNNVYNRSNNNNCV